MRVTCSFMSRLPPCAAGYRRSSRALLSNRSVKSSRSWVSASSCRRSWTPRSTSSSRAVTSADADCGRAARRRASLRTVYAGIPTNIRRAVRNTAGSKWLSSSATPVIREDVVSRLHDRVARESTLRIVPLRRRVGRGSGREPPGRGIILERGPSPPTAIREPLAVLHHKVDVMQRARHRRCGEGLQLFRVPVDLRHSGAVGERLAVARNAGPVGVDHHGIGEDRSQQASVLTDGDNLPVLVSPELGEREPTRHLHGVLVLGGQGAAAQRTHECRHDSNRPQAFALHNKFLLCEAWPLCLQLTAFFTSAPILASAAAVSSFRAKATGHTVPSSRFALSLKPNVAYLALNLPLTALPVTVVLLADFRVSVFGLIEPPSSTHSSALEDAQSRAQQPTCLRRAGLETLLYRTQG